MEALRHRLFYAAVYAASLHGIRVYRSLRDDVRDPGDRRRGGGGRSFFCHLRPADEEELDIGFPVRIYYTPGHSDDSISVYLPNDKGFDTKFFMQVLKGEKNVNTNI